MSILTDQLNRGLIGVKWNRPMELLRKYKAYTCLPGTPEYHYNLSNDVRWFPLQYGNGTYSIKVYEEARLNSNKYFLIVQQAVVVDMAQPLDVFKQANFYMDWNYNMECIKQAAKLCANLKTDRDKVQTIWAYIMDKYSYDFDFAKEITVAGGKYNYTPDLELIHAEKSGICFGLTAIFNSMLRGQGIPAKMLHGNMKNIYHAWSEVWIDNTWRHIDVTMDLGERGKRGFLNCAVKQQDYTTKFIY